MLTKQIVSHIFAANKTDSELPFLCSLGHLKHKSMGKSISGPRNVSCINFAILFLKISSDGQRLHLSIARRITSKIQVKNKFSRQKVRGGKNNFISERTICLFYPNFGEEVKKSTQNPIKKYILGQNYILQKQRYEIWL